MKNYKYRIRKDKKCCYLIFSKPFAKRYKLREGKVIELIPITKNKFIMRLG